MVAAALLLLAATSLVAGKVIRQRQATDGTDGFDIATLASFTDLATNEATFAGTAAIPTGTDIDTALATELPSSTTLGGGNIAECAFPSSITLPPGVPTLGSAAENYAATVTDACQLFGGDVPPAVAADVSSFTSSLSVWASRNAAAISSYESAANSFISAVKTDPVCSSLYSTGASIATDGQARCSGVNTAKSIASQAFSSAAGAGVTSGNSAASGSARTTTGAAGSGAITGAAASTSRAGSTGAGSTVGPHNTVLLTGACLAITSLIGMLVL